MQMLSLEREQEKTEEELLFIYSFPSPEAGVYDIAGRMATPWCSRPSPRQPGRKEDTIVGETSALAPVRERKQRPATWSFIVRSAMRPGVKPSSATDETESLIWPWPAILAQIVGSSRSLGIVGIWKRSRSPREEDRGHTKGRSMHPAYSGQHAAYIFLTLQEMHSI